MSVNPHDTGIMGAATKFFANLKTNAVATAASILKNDKVEKTTNPYVTYLASLLPVADCHADKPHPATPNPNPMGECSLSHISTPAMNLDDPNPTLFELVQLQVIMRHGARSTCELLPWETKESFAADWKQCHSPDQDLDDPNMVSCYPGQLTVSGEKMCVELGAQFRERYVNQLNFLNDNISDDAMHLESTTYARARLSLQRMLRGLFPTRHYSEEQWNTTVDPQEVMVPKPTVCANLLKQFNIGQILVENINESPEYKPHQEALARALGTDYLGSKETTWVAVGDWASSRVFHGLPTADGLSGDFLPKAEKAAWTRFQTMLSHSADSIQLGIGPLLDRITGQMEYYITGQPPAFLNPRDPASANSSSAAVPFPPADHPTRGAFANFTPISKAPPKLVVYSGHDTTLTPLTAALGIPLLSWPPYASHIEIELWRAKEVDHALAREIHHHSMRHLLTNQPEVDSLPMTPTPIDSVSLPHITRTATQRAFKDAHWVRIVFNGTAVASMPLAVFQQRVKHFRAGDAHTRMVQCGSVDKNEKPFTWI